jgi:hypothetical protein
MLWMKPFANDPKKLHRDLNVPIDKRIPPHKLKKAKASPYPHTHMRANLNENKNIREATEAARRRTSLGKTERHLTLRTSS